MSGAESAVIASLVVSAVATGASIYMQQQAASEAADAQERAAQEARDIAEANAQRAEAEGEESARRLEKQQQEEEARTRAIIGGTGTRYEDEFNSFAKALESQKKENRLSLDWEKASTVSQANIIRRGGQYQYNIGMGQAKVIKTKALGDIFSGIGNVAQTGASSYQTYTKVRSNQGSVKSGG